MRYAVTAMLALAAASAPVDAQFTPRSPEGRDSHETTRTANMRSWSQSERQRSWVAEQAHKAVRALPRTDGVSAFSQRSITAYAAPAATVVGYGREWTADDCERSIRAAEIAYNLPPYLLHAIALAESGRNGRPSPVAMNIAGRPYFATGTNDMMRVVGMYGERSSIDVGCMQINLKYHAGRFKDWRSLLVPSYNAQYAALYLTELYRRYGTWSGAVGAYHSSTPWKSADYACLISRKWGQIFGSTRDGCGPDLGAMANLLYRTMPNRG